MVTVRVRMTGRSERTTVLISRTKEFKVSEAKLHGKNVGPRHHAAGVEVLGASEAEPSLREKASTTSLRSNLETT